VTTLTDTRRGHRTALETNISNYIQSGVAEPPLPDCAAAISRALEVGAKRTLFFYLDPYGIADLDFEMLRRVFARGEAQSTEVLINFSFPTFMRMSGSWSYDESAEHSEPFDGWRLLGTDRYGPIPQQDRA
jgi:hypothetical protein